MLNSKESIEKHLVLVVNLDALAYLIVQRRLLPTDPQLIQFIISRAALCHHKTLGHRSPVA